MFVFERKSAHLKLSCSVVTTCAALFLTVACGDDPESTKPDSGAAGDRDAGGDGDNARPDDGDAGGDGDNTRPDDPTAVLAPSMLEAPDVVDSSGRIRLLPRAVTQQGDAFVVAGDCAGDLCAVRLSASGQVDTAFGDKGLVRLDAGGMVSSIAFLTTNLDGAYAVLAHEDKLYLAGYAWAPAGALAHAFVIARLDVDGELDTTFGKSGLTVIDVVRDDLSNPARFGALTVDATGRPYGVGTITQAGGTTDIVVARFTSAGAIDTTYPVGGAGAFLQRPGNQAGLFVVPSGTGFVVGGNSVLARVDDAGKIDTSFGTNGFVAVGSELAQALVARDGGALLTAGFTKADATDDRTRIRCVQTVATGAFDEDFGPAGEVHAEYDLTLLTLDNGERVSGNFGVIRGMSSLSDGGLLVYGSLVSGLKSNPILLRLDGAAKPVRSFGSEGILGTNASLPLLQDLNGLEPPSRLLVVDDSFYVADVHVDESGSYLSFWSGEL